MATTLPPQPRWTVGRTLEVALSLLAVVFLVVLLIQVFGDVSPRTNRRLNLISTAIWMVFGVDFFTRLALAPDRKAFLRHNWVTAAALVLPMFRAVRILQIAKAAPSVPAAGLIEGSRRGTLELRHAFGARPALFMGVFAIFVVALSTVGMYAIERDSDKQPNITTLGDSLWWTMATLTTIGSELYPVTGEGRAFAIVIMIFSVGFSGYVTGSVVSLLLGATSSAPPDAHADDAGLRNEIRALREQLATLSRGSDAAQPRDEAAATPTSVVGPRN